MKCCISWSGLAVFATALVAAAVLADEPKEPAAPAQQEALLKQITTRGAHHERLDGLAGKWKLAVKWRNKPNDKWAESQGVVRYEWILGRRFLREDFQYDTGDEKVEWLGIYGYDNFQKKYTAVWVDNGGTNTEFATGEYDAQGKVLSYLGEQDDPPTGGKRSFKWLITIEGPDKLRYDSFDQNPPGKYFKNTEIVATRMPE
jgi:hypothetical protein